MILTNIKYSPKMIGFVIHLLYSKRELPKAAMFPGKILFIIPEHWPSPKRKGSSSNHQFFRGYSFREGICQVFIIPFLGSPFSRFQAGHLQVLQLRSKIAHLRSIGGGHVAVIILGDSISTMGHHRSITENIK